MVWSCDRCTFDNENDGATCCDICGASRPVAVAKAEAAPPKKKKAPPAKSPPPPAPPPAVPTSPAPEVFVVAHEDPAAGYLADLVREKTAPAARPRRSWGKSTSSTKRGWA